MPRRSAASLAIVTPVRQDRPEPFLSKSKVGSAASVFNAGTPDRTHATDAARSHRR
jgi:hypothetical protein